MVMNDNYPWLWRTQVLVPLQSSRMQEVDEALIDPDISQSIAIGDNEAYSNRDG